MVADLEESLASMLADGAEPGDLAAAVREAAPLLSHAEVRSFVGRVTRRTEALGPLESILSDPAVTEIMVNGPGPVWVERGGSLQRTDVVISVAEIMLLVERVATPLGRSVNRLDPILDARLHDGSRINVVLPPLAVDGPAVTIRRFGTRAIGLDEFGPGAAAVGELVAKGRTLVVAGGTGAGKTTLLNAVAQRLDPSLRVVTIEDTAELRLGSDHVVRLEARPPNAEGLGGASIRDLVRTALRMRPDRIVVGEVRGPEALDLILALGTGHDGSLATVHARSVAGAMSRLETLAMLADGSAPVEAIRRQLLDAVDAVVMVRRCGAERRITEVAEVDADRTEMITRWVG